MYQFLSDIVLIVHAAFIVFVLLGGLLILRWPKWRWLHLPAVIWTVFIELTGGICPLTPLENYFRVLAGREGYQGDFIQHYLLSLVYPAALTPSLQMILAGVVLALNLIIYSMILIKRSKTR